jgi:hypothetical protein
MRWWFSESFVSRLIHVPSSLLKHRVIISAITYVVDGRKNFIGPRDLHVLLDLAKTGQAEQVQHVLANEGEKRR